MQDKVKEVQNEVGLADAAAAATTAALEAESTR